MPTVWFDDDDALDLELVGAKGAHLAELWRAGFSVPFGFVLPIADFRAAMARNGLGQAMRELFVDLDPSDLAALRAAAGAARRLVLDQGPGAAVDEAIRTAYRALGCAADGAPVAVAVRSSSTVEDLEDSSGAGLQETTLWVRGEDDVVHHVVRCWASLFAARSIDHRLARGLDVSDAAMAVVVQLMVLPTSAGVALTIDPLTGDRSRIVIDSAFGLGESVVSGVVTPDHFVVDKHRHEIVRRTISTKECEIIVLADRLGQRPLDPQRANRPSLSDDNVLAVAQLARLVEEYFGTPQDIEWAICDSPDGTSSEVHLLQSRPETVASRRVTQEAPRESAGLDDVVETLRRPFAAGQQPPALLQPASPFGQFAAPGTEGWRSMYPASLTFDPARPQDAEAFWFRDGVHWPRPIAPFDSTILQFALTSLSQFNSRHFHMPAALGVDVRLVNGYCYLSPVGVDDQSSVDQRSEEFRQRAGYYYEHWDDLYAGWMEKVRATIGRLDLLDFEPLPESISRAEVFSGRGLGAPSDLTRSYHALLDGALELWQYHFEFLNLGYAAYLDFFEFCRRVCGDVEELTVARMVAGLDVDLFRPDRELRRLARAAVDQGIADFICAGSIEELIRLVPYEPRAARWWDDYQSVQEPWFNYSNGSGFYHDDAVWIDRPVIPFGYVRSYVQRLLAGEEIDKPDDEIAAQRDAIAADFARRIPSSEVPNFEAKLRLARTVFHFVENHNFYVEHWGMSIVWRKMRALSAVFVRAGWWARPDDIFMLRRDEVSEALWDLLGGWATGRDHCDSDRWAVLVADRARLLEACAAWTPPHVLGRAPKLVNEPFTVMLWGITAESVQALLGDPGDGDELVGFAASPGIAVGRARVVHHPDSLVDVLPGEVLVTGLTSPSWAPVFRRLAATVTDTGGIMSHAAIVCREYGLPAVTGTGFATTRISTGQLVRVDGTNGRVTVLREPDEQITEQEVGSAWIS